MRTLSSLLRWIALALWVSALSGCTWTLFTAADAAGSVVQAGMSVASKFSSPTFVTGTPAALDSVCIELNRNVSSGDFVPSLQLAFQRRGVSSMVYNAGTAPPGCEALLMYSATIDWGQRAFSDSPVAYLAQIDLTLLRQGQVLVSARYETGGLNTDRFESAKQKVDALVGKMVMARGI